MKIHTLIVGGLATNCYLAVDEKTREAAIIDPGEESEKILKFIKEQRLKPLFIINTHGHPDHTSANESLKKELQIPVCIHKNDLDMLRPVYTNAARLMYGLRASSSNADRTLEEGDEIQIGGMAFKVLHTPGHSPGSICLYFDQTLFSGDTMFAEGDYGRTDLWGGSEKEMQQSLKRLQTLPQETRVYPGHGAATSLAKWRAMNSPW